MNKHTPLQAIDAVSEAIDLIGGDSAVARLVGIRPWAVSKWRKALPPSRVIWLAEKTDWRKTPHQLCPALYPNPDDGVPPGVRSGYEVASA
ncbi:Cro/CI family transcriptional regulator [Caballeronia sp. LZ033]|uniref:Cro/CI family transcriptional regulator n=1 Tax=Caballeronia sp. LZ033 TaxID=3038566 RepID=UPI00285A118F|nr:Cro/CI family transcriptional regulator [Caballeronia sp. LZ033]MDR5815824.1 Cro/CI family transcriptional regulator [Caballeronia sp. LZ033]